MFPIKPCSRTKTAVILCNGPSLRGFDFAENMKGHVTFGMNLAYRHWDTINWYPTYYSCLDRVVGVAHLEDIGRLISNAESYGIKGFLVRHNVVEALNLQHNSLVFDFDRLLEADSAFFRGYWANTGSLTTAWAAKLGYRRLLLLGADASYSKYVPGAVHVNKLVLKLEAQPSDNPNYFIDDYQRKGDIYHVPFWEDPDFPHEDQLLGWHMIRPQLHESHTVVVNANPDSRITAFPRCRLEEAPRVFRAVSHQRRREQKHLAPSPSFAREDGAVLHTADLIAELYAQKKGLVVDVGAHHGVQCLPFLKQGWRAHAVEPDPQHRSVLRQLQSTYSTLHVVNATMSCVHGRTYPWQHHHTYGQYHSMKCFSKHCQQAGEVTTTTMRQWTKAAGIDTIDVLLCDVVGFEFIVLRGTDLENAPPECIVCAWDDLKSLHLGSDRHDVGSFLLACGYQVYMSEWHPVLDPALPQQWKGLLRYPAEPDSFAWGHFLAFRNPIRPGRLQQLVKKYTETGVVLPPHPLPPMPQRERMPYVIRY